MARRCSCGPAFSEIPTLSLAKGRDPYGLKYLQGNILPLRVALRKQRDLLFPSEFFNLLFTSGGYLGVAVGFKIDQPVNFVLLGETIKQAGFVLCHPPSQIIRKADI